MSWMAWPLVTPPPVFNLASTWALRKNLLSFSALYLAPGSGSSPGTSQDSTRACLWFGIALCRTWLWLEQEMRHREIEVIYCVIYQGSGRTLIKESLGNRDMRNSPLKAHENLPAGESRACFRWISLITLLCRRCSKIRMQIKTPTCRGKHPPNTGVVWPKLPPTCSAKALGRFSTIFRSLGSCTLFEDFYIYILYFQHESLMYTDWWHPQKEAHHLSMKTNQNDVFVFTLPYTSYHLSIKWMNQRMMIMNDNDNSQHATWQSQNIPRRCSDTV